MKTAAIDNLLEQLIYCDLRTDVGVDKAKDAIRLALRKQDRDTRHACAEAVNILTHTDERGDARIDRDLSDVESVILETKAV